MKEKFIKITAFIKLHKIAFISALATAVVLCFAFALGSNQGAKEQTQAVLSTVSASVDEADTEATAQPTSVLGTDATKEKVTASSGSATSSTDGTQSVSESMKESSQASKSNSTAEKSKSESSTTATQDRYKTDPIPEGKPQPVEPQEQEIEDTKLYCTISVSCATILDNLSELDSSKKDIVPDDGWILKPTKVEFNEGESVFDVLKRVCQEQKIHMEFSWTPIYNSAYIEGIGNLYEFDCGSQSGWMYCVNDWFPNYGCSRYQLKNGDTLEFKYTCVGFGADIGADMNFGE